MKIKFLGAAGTVTGSKYLITTKNGKYLVDCGLFQGLKPLRERNWQKLFLNPSEIRAIFLTHAHIDHSGYIPRLIKEGFHGSIFCSHGTFELAKILLPDSGHLQEEEAEYANRKGFSVHTPALPLYTRNDAENALRYFVPINFHRSLLINDDVKITLYYAGHIIGASFILVEAANRSIIFSGDVGRYGDPIMLPPEPLPHADYLMLESTYGDRSHHHEDLLAQFATIINHAYFQGGTIVVPAFAIGRAQHILYLMSLLKKKNLVGDLKIFLDSPMAINATDIYCRFRAEHRLNDEECKDMSAVATIARSPEESRAINEVPPPKVIISASGMATGGRVLHHLAQYISDERNVIIIVGYQAEGTRGRALLDGTKEIKMFGNTFSVLAKVEDISGLSAHADWTELLKWLKNSPIKNPRVFLVHGEPKASQSLSEKIKETFGWHVDIPIDGQEVKL